MSTLHYGIRDALHAQIAASPAIVPAGNVLLARRRPVPKAVAAQIFVDLDDAPAVAQTMAGVIEWNTKFRVEIVARDGASQKADAIADDLMGQVYARVMESPTVGGRALDIWPAGMAWRIEDEGDATVSACAVIFNTRHRTPRASVAAI